MPSGSASEVLPRVLIVTPSSPLDQGGVQRHVLEVSRRLAAAGVTVEVLCAQPGGPRLAELERDGVRIRIVRAWPAKRDWHFAPGIWREAARRDWDIVHVQSYHTFVAPLAMLRALRLGVPYVVTFHGGGHSSPWRHRLRTLHRRFLRPLLIRAERLVAVARFEIEVYGRELGTPAAQWVLIPNGVDVDVLGSSRHDRGAGPEHEGRVLASIGRLERYKGHHRVIAALPHVLRTRPEVRLLIVGSGPYETELRELASELGLDGHVQFTSVSQGDAHGMSSLLSEIDLVVLLSDFETHPLTGLEAAAAGVRLLVADRGGLLELAEDGLARSISPDAPSPHIAGAIIEELNRAPPSRQPVLTTWDDCAGDLLGLYRSICGSPEAERRWGRRRSARRPDRRRDLLGRGHGR